ncbi:MAG: HrcA family transcriptional regulator, partial [Gammaproteobacteria bacterium]
YLDRNYEASELRGAARFLNEQFAGKEIGSVREELIRRLDETQQQMNDLMVAVVRMAQQIFEGDEEGGFVLAGETNLMDFAELSDVDKLRRLFEAFNEQRDILHLLDRCLAAEGVQIFIGQESGFEILDECSIVTAPYTVDDETVGVLGVIGPTRMAYERVIPIVDLTARLLGAALKSR